MPRKARIDIGGLCYHVVNRGNERQTIFHNDTEYASFIGLLETIRSEQTMRVLAFCLMPNHFHLCLWPVADGDLGRFMQQVTTSHVSQFRKSYPGVGHVWQGRFKSSATQSNTHLLRVLRYIERNPVRASLALSAAEWPWSSAGLAGQDKRGNAGVLLNQWPIAKPVDWLDSLGISETDADLDLIRKHLQREAPLGDAGWQRDLIAPR